MQTVQIQIGRHIMWHLIRVYIVCYQDFPPKIEYKQQYRPDTPKMTNGLVQHITVKESTSIQWVNKLLQFQMHYSRLSVSSSPGLSRTTDISK